MLLHTAVPIGDVLLFDLALNCYEKLPPIFLLQSDIPAAALCSASAWCHVRPSIDIKKRKERKKGRKGSEEEEEKEGCAVRKPGERSG